MTRKIALEKIRIDFATNGKDSGEAMRIFSNNKISYKAYMIAGRLGLAQFNLINHK